ncbi:MAG TPA: outer membrane beta-barrel protein [Burkholderiales bacterium]
MRMLVSAAFIAASLVSQAALAQVPFPPPPEPSLSGAYFGGLFGRSQAKKGCLGFLSGSNRTCDDTDPAFGLFGGYRFGRYLAGEVAYNDLGKVRSSTSTATENAHAGAWEVSGLGIVPIDRDFAFYGRIGGYRATLQSSRSDIADRSNTGLTYGGGIQWEFPRNLGLRGQWQRYKDVGGEGSPYGVNIYDVISIGVLWHWR